MIGVIPKPSEIRAAQEFFQLFKTPWEPYVPGRQYDVVLFTSDDVPSHPSAKVVLVYNSKIIPFDHDRKLAVHSQQRKLWLEADGAAFPVYGDVLVFQPTGRPCLRVQGTSEPAGLDVGQSTQRVVRFGYDLFQEVAFLLSEGQPPANAHVPTLELHISMLRDQALRAGVPLVEVPPVPPGYDFMVCLTHDVDFVGIRQHRFDQTMWGFLYRALVGSVSGVLRGRLAWRKLLRNWTAAFSLPAVHLGLRSDFWLEFDRYAELEKDLGSTFFFIPYKNAPGVQGSGPAPGRRAAKYDLAETRAHVLELIGRGCEIGLHGLDAWRDPGKGRAELSRITEITGPSEVGVRMHWLYFSEDSPRILEEAGFSYDSTFGYNNTIGFRAGTPQAFCPLTAQSLLELPLTIQDTAMFYPDHLNLTEAEALDACKRLIQSAARFGGALTVNWHTRSLSPERLWGDFYLRLLEQMQTHRVWFGRAAEIVQWFRQRRALRFESVETAGARVHLKLAGAAAAGQPPLTLRIYQPQPAPSARPASKPSYSDIPWKGEAELDITV